MSESEEDSETPNTEPIGLNHIIQERAALQCGSNHPYIAQLRYAFQVAKFTFEVLYYFRKGLTCLRVCSFF